jgi:hypothetical protein
MRCTVTYFAHKTGMLPIDDFGELKKFQVNEKVRGGQSPNRNVDVVTSKASQIEHLL